MGVCEDLCAKRAAGILFLRAIERPKSNFIYVY